MYLYIGELIEIIFKITKIHASSRIQFECEKWKIDISRAILIFEFDNLSGFMGRKPLN